MKLRDESGQAIVLTTLFSVVLIGAMALAIDVGSWFRLSRQAQATADAAALSGAEALPVSDTTTAYNVASQYASANGGGLDPGGITFQSELLTNDTVSVNISRPAAGFFSVLFGIDSTNVHATASARAGIPTQVRYVAPIAVYYRQAELYPSPCPCFGVETSIPLGKVGIPGGFGVLDLDSANKGGSGTSVVAGWLQNGYGDYLGLGDYNSDPGAKFSSSQIQAAFSLRLGTELLFPVYDTTAGNGSGGTYHVIGWAGYVADGYMIGKNLTGTCPPGTTDAGTGNSGTICGHFTQVIWDGIQSTTSGSMPNYGVYTVSLVN